MWRLLFLLFLLPVTSCQPAPSGFVYLLDQGQWAVYPSRQQTLAEFCQQAACQLQETEQVTYLGRALASSDPLPAMGVLQIRRRVAVTLAVPTGEKIVHSAAPTVGEFLAGQGYALSQADFVAPEMETPLSDGLRILYRPAQVVVIQADGKRYRGFTSAETVGQALAQAGIPLLGLDSSLPGESAPLPPDGLIRVIRVSETLHLQQRSIPFQTEYVDSPEVDLGQEAILQPGQPGLAVQRTRSRYEDGLLAATREEAERTILQPTNRVTARGSRISLTTLEIPGGKIKYWRAVSMYATSYSPCRSGGSKCYYGTASGLPVQRGVVGMRAEWYQQLVGVRVYIPGYGVATVADYGGGFPDGRPWIDLAYSDDDYQPWSQWVTVYFLEPAPAAVPYVLK